MPVMKRWGHGSMANKAVYCAGNCEACTLQSHQERTMWYKFFLRLNMPYDESMQGQSHCQGCFLAPDTDAAKTRGHVLHAENDEHVSMRERRTRSLEYQK
jgi:hypothetical protein